MSRKDTLDKIRYCLDLDDMVELFEFEIEKAKKESIPKEIIDILSNVLYWETCPEEYKKTIKKYLLSLAKHL